MNPERPIEKLLQAFARKRREQAGDGFDLHPATRRLLQGEVARQYGRTGSEFAGWAWARLWPRLAFASATLAVLVVAAVILMPPGQKPEKTLYLAKGEVAARPIGVAPIPRPSAAPAPVAEGPLADKLPAPKTVQFANKHLATGPARAMMPSEPDQAVRNEAVQERAVSPAEVSAITDKPKSSADGLRAPVTQAPTPPETLLVPATPIAALAEKRPASLAVTAKDVSAAREPRAKTELEPKLALADSQADAAQMKERFAGVVFARKARSEADANMLVRGEPEPASREWAFDQSTQKQYFANRTAALTRTRRQQDVAQVILNSFQLEQRGPEIRIVDEDGSVYTGTVQSADTLPRSGAAKPKAATVPTVRSPRAHGSAYGVAKPAEVLPAAAPAAQFLNFTVRGTNATLRQALEFVGNLQPDPAASRRMPSNQVQTVSVLYQNQSPAQRQNPSQLLNSRITGRARLANGAELEINAVPLAVDVEAGRK